MAEDEKPTSKDDAAERFRRLLSDQEGEPLGTADLLHHPTGYPEETGGWYGQEPVDLTRPSAPPDHEEKPPPLVGTMGLPLPRRVSEIDEEATRVVQPGPGSQPTRVSPSTRPISRPPTPPSRPIPPTPGSHRQPAPPKSSPIDWEILGGCFLRAVILAIFSLILVGMCGASFMVFEYYKILKELPDIENLQQHTSQFETTRILDRNGNVIYEILDPNAGRRTYVPLAKISPFLVAATVATEDKDYYSHPGYDPTAILRAFWQNARSGDTVSGASTITQQLARNLLFTPEERSQRSYDRKLREALLASELTRRYTKDEILEIYLNENYYGNLAYGVEAAAETYFRSPGDKLTLGQSAFLAGLPQAPAVYDIYTDPTLTLKRQSDVLVLMYKVSQEQGCIYVSNSPQRVCVDAVNATQARDEIANYQFPSPDVPIKFPHWVNYIRQQLETQFDAQTIYRSGFSVQTTIDPELQELAENVVKEQVQKMGKQHVTDGALIAIQPATGEILAMVGSADFDNEAIHGQVNMATSPRQPGSSIKPLTYLAAFEKGWTPATLIWDVPSEFPPSGRSDDNRPPYKPVNYDEKYHGPVRLRYALANSYNIPAVKTLQFVGIYDDPTTNGEDGLLAFARRMGITTLTRQDYGLSLTLGGGEVSLLELTRAYSIVANQGKKVPLVSITKILDYQGNVVFEASHDPVEQVIRPEHAFLMTSILSDNDARTPAFGADSVLNLPFPAAVKTGTTNDYRDNWTLGFTPDLAVGVWVGNADYTPMENVSGVAGAGPIWAAYMKKAANKINDGQITPFSRPNGIMDKSICAISGSEPSEWCPKKTNEIFASDQPPLTKDEDLIQKAQIDTWTGLKASSACSGFSDEKTVLNVTDTWAVKWLKKDAQGKTWLKDNGIKKDVQFTPDRECKADDPRPKLVFDNLHEGDTITDATVDIYGVTDATKNFDYYQVLVGHGNDPDDWDELVKSDSPVKTTDLLYSWNLSDEPAGEVTLKLYLHSTEDTYAELKIHLHLQVPTQTPTLTFTPTATNVPTNTPMPSNTTAPTDTPTPSSTPTP